MGKYIDILKFLMFIFQKTIILGNNNALALLKLRIRGKDLEDNEEREREIIQSREEINEKRIQNEEI